MLGLYEDKQRYSVRSLVVNIVGQRPTTARIADCLLCIHPQDKNGAIFHFTFSFKYNLKIPLGWNSGVLLLGLILI